MNRLHVFGLGYSAQHFLAQHRSRFSAVTATVRSPDRARSLAAEGLTVRAVNDPGTAGDIAAANALLLSAPPDENGSDPALARFGEAIARAGPGLRWVGYLSTVGVYGDRSGAWVDETTLPVPGSARSRARLAAEESWLATGRRLGCPVHIFRLAGIYGPGRNALAQLAAGTARRIVKPGQVFNRIHVADIARALASSLERPRHGAIYHLADDEPSPPQDVVAYAAGLLGIPPPPEQPFGDAALSPMAASFYAESKRVSNGATKAELGLTLRYPSYREGLSALHAAGEGRPSSASSV